jgi:hypothetical protein
MLNIRRNRTLFLANKTDKGKAAAMQSARGIDNDAQFQPIRKVAL